MKRGNQKIKCLITTLIKPIPKSLKVLFVTTIIQRFKKAKLRTACKETHYIDNKHNMT